MAVFSFILLALLLLCRALEKKHAATGYLIFTLCVLIAKLVLVAGNEIVSEHSDAWSYINAASEFPRSSVGANPGYPGWLWISMVLGVPQRIAIEILFVFSGAVFSMALGRFAFGFVGYALLLLLTVFSPVSYFLFDRALSDGMYICLSLMAVGWSVLCLQTGRRAVRWALLLLLGLTMGGMALTRSEVPLLVVAMLSLAALSIFLLIRVDQARWSEACVKTFFRFGFSSLIATMMVFGVMSIHWYLEGVWAQTLSGLPAHTNLLARLAAIKVQAPHQRFVPISREARFLAYQNSPTLSQLRPIIEAADNPYKLESERVLGMAGEVGAGWIWHIFNDAAAKHGIKTVRELDRFYRQANAELDTAFTDGKLGKEFVLQPLLGSDSSVWLPFIRDGLSNVLVGATRAPEPQMDADFESNFFDRICLRRSALMQKNEGLIKGWAFAKRNKLSGIVVEPGTASGAQSAAPALFSATHFARPDVQEGFRKEGLNIPLDSGFAARIPLRANQPIRLRFTLEDGQVATADHPVVDQVRVATASAGTDVVFGIDTLPSDTGQVKSGWRGQVMQTALGIYRNRSLWVVALILAVSGFCVLAWRATAGDKPALISLAGALLIASWIVFRLGFYAVIDAAAWGAEPRYVLMSGLFLSTLAVTGLLACFRRRP